jgi:hypothetical protein
MDFSALLMRQDLSASNPDAPGGRLRGIYRAAVAAGPVEALDEVEITVGRGVTGDRYAVGTGTFSARDEVREITLFAQEALDAFQVANAPQTRVISASALRRNFLTQGVELERLVGKQFRIGDTLLLGLRLCPPCAHLARLLEMRSILRDLAHSGGIYAQVLVGGMVRLGDAVAAEDSL